MDCHIGQKNVRHALAESAKVGTGKEINVNSRNFADYSRLKHLAHLPDSPIEPSILDNGVYSGTALSQFDQIGRIGDG
jgi:hypothetical protein